MPERKDQLDSLQAAEAIRSWEAQRRGLDQTLQPMNICCDVQKKCVRETKGEHGMLFEVDSYVLEVRPEKDDQLCYASGLRVFNGPREVIIEQIHIGRADQGVYASPFDAAAFNLEGPMPPLRAGDPYKGEPMRFCQQSLGCFTRDHPLRVTLRPWQAMERGVPHLGFPPFDGLLFVQVRARAGTVEV